MPSYGEPITVSYTAWDTANNVPKTGDATNHTLKWVKNGTPGTPTNAPSEVSGGGGTYLLSLTATEAQTYLGTICGVSTTTGVAIIAKDYAFERLPTAALATSGGLPTVGTADGQMNLLAGNTAANVVKVAGTPAVAVDGTLASATASTITFQSTDSAGNAIPDDARFANCAIKFNGGLGQGQIVITTTKAASPSRTFNVLASTMPITPDSTTTYVVLSSCQATLTPTGLDAVTPGTYTGVASTFTQKIDSVWRRLNKKIVKDRSTLTVKTFADDNTTVMTTQSFSDDGAGSESLTASI